jgi:hypothetical protein
VFKGCGRFSFLWQIRSIFFEFLYFRTLDAPDAALRKDPPVVPGWMRVFLSIIHRATGLTGSETMTRKTTAKHICEELEKAGKKIDPKVARQGIKDGWKPKRPENIKKYGQKSAK